MRYEITQEEIDAFNALGRYTQAYVYAVGLAPWALAYAQGDQNA